MTLEQKIKYIEDIGFKKGLQSFSLPQNKQASISAWVFLSDSLHLAWYPLDEDFILVLKDDTSTNVTTLSQSQIHNKPLLLSFPLSNSLPFSSLSSLFSSHA